MRSSMLETLGEDYVLTARAKGLPTRRIIWRHAVRNALLPIVTLVALDLGCIVGGAILVEVIFSWPGIGQALFTADHPARLPDAAGRVPDPHCLRGRAESPADLRLLQARPEDHPVTVPIQRPVPRGGRQSRRRARRRLLPQRAARAQGRCGRTGDHRVLRLLAIAAPYIAPYSPTAQTCAVFAPPSVQPLAWLRRRRHRHAQRDHLRAAGSRWSIGFAATLIAMIIGGGVGILSGYFGRWVDVSLMRITDYLLVIPDLAFAMVIADRLGREPAPRDRRDRDPGVGDDGPDHPGPGDERQGTRLHQARHARSAPATPGSSGGTSCRRSGRC